MSVPVVFTAGTLQQGYCFTTPQQFYSDIIAILSGTVAAAGKVIVSGSAPGPADQDAVWVRTVGGYLEGIYLFLGQWSRPYPVPASSKERRIWTDTEANSWAYDGGDGTDPGSVAPTATSGAMWQVDHTLDFKMPIGAGTNGVTYDGNAASAITVGSSVTSSGNAGEERHLLSGPESGVQAHTHDLVGYALIAGSNFNAGGNNDRGGNVTGGVSGGAKNASLSHQNLPPFQGVYFIKRTVRQYITAS